MRFDDLRQFNLTIGLLQQRILTARIAKDRALLATLERLYCVVRDAISAGPQQPADNELIWRCVSGDVDALSVCHVAGWTMKQLIDQCRYRGLPLSLFGEADD